MDLINSNPIIISAGIGGWYSAGIDRLERSLNFVGSPIPWMTWKDYPPNCYRHDDYPYYFKIAAFEAALAKGYTHILWVDASFWAVKSPMLFFDIIDEQGYYMFSSGYNMAQTVNDRCVEFLRLNRNELEYKTEWASGCVGFNFNNPDGKAIYAQWKEYMDMGLSAGSRLHDNQSQDPRFLFHRQDQSCLSLAMLKLGLRNEKGLDFVAYHGTNYNPDEVIFFIKGI